MIRKKPVMTPRQALQLIAHNDGDIPTVEQVEAAIRGLAAYDVPSKAPEKSVLLRIFRGTPAKRRQELKKHVQFLLHNRGLKDLLTALISVLEGMRPTEPYLQVLIQDLKHALNNYNARYAGDPK